jgi:hypothetical protein
MIQLVITVDQFFSAFQVRCFVYEIGDGLPRRLIAVRSDTLPIRADDDLHDPFASAVRLTLEWAERINQNPTNDLSWGDVLAD